MNEEILVYEKIEEKENRKYMLNLEQIADGVTKEGKKFRVLQSPNRNLITIICDGFYYHVILENIISTVLGSKLTSRINKAFADGVLAGQRQTAQAIEMVQSAMYGGKEKG